MAWIVAAIVVVNALIATLIVIVLARSPSTQTLVRVQPAGGGSTDAQVRDLLQRLEAEQRELEHKLAEIQELRALVIELSDKVKLYEQREHTVIKPHDRAAPPVAMPDQQPVDPYASDTIVPTTHTCDEVSCVLSNYPDACCQKFKVPQGPAPKDNLADSIDRTSISNAIASVRPSVTACGTRYPAKGKVKVRVRVSPKGLVTEVTVEEAQSAPLARCVAGAVQRAVFPQTHQGGSFSYPFVF